ncbi:prepilin-type N-terminal cleavage/methylation domain-containing protein [Anaerotignum sp.]|uniref:prepilin-type N-terminal cleavage/methylation domain-containing protein n=1 Tax=Anaerotignum sp. TaxID=2039241 RepID=UPI0028A5DABE|nr:prepilin-type N-terminal cleavage/methylation domain-containing protein [Anaerotignum sp.]
MIQALKAKRKSKKGFTLMEMLIVIAIIAILVAIAIPTFSGAQKKAQYAADMANVRAWYAESLVKNMAEGTALPTTGTGSYNGSKLQMSSATVTVAGTTADDFTVTYDPKDSDTTKYKPVTFPTPAEKAKT